MNHTDELLMLMQDGTPYTLEEIVDATGMDETMAKNAIYRLTRGGLLSARPLRYRVTPDAARRVNSIKNRRQFLRRPS